jgi:hypothetical protein
VKSLVGVTPTRTLIADYRVGWAKYLLNQCVNNHAKCQYSMSGRKYDDDELECLLPTRVIDLNEAGSTGQPYVLVTNGRRGRYAALSYCWGASTHITATPLLTKSTIMDFQSGLPLQKLPKTIRDAMLVAKDAGIRYLWVDRLCIIQDDAVDWEEEAKLMCETYERAFLTISALGADHDNSGLFPLSDSTSSPFVTLNCFPDGERMFVFKRPQMHHKGGLRGELRQSRWDSRAWVLQERLLSRRIIYFGKKQAYWECNSQSDFHDSPTETFNTVRVNHGSKPRVLQSLQEGQRQLRPGLVSGKLTYEWSAGLLWARIVHDYTSRNLSTESDRAMAIDGVSKAYIERFPGIDYSYGLWSNYLGSRPGGLLWYRISEVHLTRPETWLGT